MITEFKGYERSNGYGTRNHILVIPTVTCSEFTSNRIQSAASKFYNTRDGKVKVLHNAYGCCQAGKDLEMTTRTLINAGKNTNVAGVVVLSLGCESVDYERVANEISSVKPVSMLKIQDSNIKNTILRATEEIKKVAEDAKKISRKEADVGNLTVGLHAGGSDYTSGLASNPVVGKVSDWIVEYSGTTISFFSPEIIGSEGQYLKKASDEKVRSEILGEVNTFEDILEKEEKSDLRGGEPTPGNIQGGLTTLEEKALGLFRITGKSTINGVLDYAEIPKTKGHFLMRGPGFDVVSVSGRVAAGSNVVLFTTGRGTPTGNVISPVIKVTANADSYTQMQDFIDFDASAALEDEKNVEKNAGKLWAYLIRIANGKLTKSELNRQDDFSIHRIGNTY